MSPQRPPSDVRRYTPLHGRLLLWLDGDQISFVQEFYIRALRTSPMLAQLLQENSFIRYEDERVPNAITTLFLQE